MKIPKPIVSTLTLAMIGAMNITAQTPADFVPYKKIDLRLPSVPLIVNDPYFSIWSNYNTLNGGPTRMWCEHEKAIEGILRVDGTSYRFMGQGKQNILKPVAGMTIDGEDWSGKVSYDRQSDTKWAQPEFDDSGWATETAAWGTKGEYPNVKNPWTGDNKDIYVRRTVNLSKDDLDNDLWIVFSHDDVFELYVNGKQVVSTGETWRQGEQHQLSKVEKQYLKEGDNIIAAHCHNTSGGSYIDYGLYENILQEGPEVQMAKQNSVDVLATSSYFNFTCGPVNLDLVFTAPMLIDDFDLISTPINFISYQVTSNDGKEHDVQFYIGTTPQLVVNEMSQPTLTSLEVIDGVTYAKSGSEEQNILGRSGDMISIDWGYLYIPAINGNVSIAPAELAESTFINSGKLAPNTPGTVRSTNISDMPVINFVNDLGKVKEARDFMMIGYDEVFDMQYMKNNYKAYYARDGKTIFEQFKNFQKDYASLMARCRDLDKMIYDDGLAAGNVKYAEQLSGTYRHVMAAHKLFQDNTGKALYFSKENKSNGCVNTVDLTYPESPLYLLYNPELQKGMILSILDYALTPERKNAGCAAHDLGQYPLANGQVYGDTMPLEESANILILADAICRITGDGEWLKPYRTVLKTWADYCHDNGQNPGNQLCTDDFKGPSEQNTNLSLKAIMGVAAYANLIPYIDGNSRDVEKYQKYAQEMAMLWEADARDGDHYKMEFHKPGTWSQKYNIVWDKMWGLDLFPPQVIDREVNFYLNHQSKYGLPLDSRDQMTKSDWIMWTASLAPDTETFLKFADKHYDYINETPSRIPLSDFYWADSGVSCNFSARSVIGGLWMKVLMDKYAPKEENTAWEPKGNHIKTRWAAQVDPNCPWPEYPRPLMERADWVNLNGLWDYAITNTGGLPADEDFNSQILVPFAIESSLSGVMKPLEPGKAIWYKKEIEIPEEWKGKNVMLNFGAVDYQADVFANGTGARNRIGSHIGGHTAFSVDLTPSLNDGKMTLYVRAIDETNEGRQPVGKQRRYPVGGGDINYTSTSGIWQTVWMEPVGTTYITDIRTTPDIDNSTLNFDVALSGTIAGTVSVEVSDNGTVVAQKTVPASEAKDITLEIPNAKLWSPDFPNLYDVKVVFANGDDKDEVDSYAALRKISYAKDKDGYWRLQLNNKDLFQFGPLDQGYWPDGILTAPTDEALRYDLEKTKDWGFNMVRKHMKVEPARWYWHCDNLGLLVWQDMPSQFTTDEGDWNTQGWFRDHNCTIDPTIEKNFVNEWTEIIDQHYSYPCIVVWTPFNERWGQFKTAEITALTQQLDPTRLVNPASGGNHYKLGEGTFVDQHIYDQPVVVYEGVFDETRPYVLGEYGGLGRNMPDHRWYDRNSQTYNTYPNEKSLTDAYVTLAGQVKEIAKGYEKDGKKISYGAAVYTQTTDVETEVNGIMTYDREIVKMDEDRIRAAAKALTTVYDDPANVAMLPFEDGIGEPIYYDVTGLRHNTPVPGINIVVLPNGNSYKILVK